jgi:hypothetical protein
LRAWSDYLVLDVARNGFLLSASLLAIGCASTPATAKAPTVVEVGPVEQRPPVVPPSPPGSDGCRDVIEDAEDGDNQILLGSGRSGYLYTYVDPEGSTVAPVPGNFGGVFEPATPGARDSAHALRFSGTLVEAGIVFAGLGLNLLDPKSSYDASRYTGIAFFARSGTGSGRVKVEMPDQNTDPDGGKCSSCYNDFGQVVSLDSSWRRFSVRFSDMKQEPGWGMPRPETLDRRHVYSIQFQVDEPGPFDVWIDDVAFCVE